jgi:hypothetical protein
LKNKDDISQALDMNFVQETLEQQKNFTQTSLIKTYKTYLDSAKSDLNPQENFTQMTKENLRNFHKTQQTKSQLYHRELHDKTH